MPKSKDKKRSRHSSLLSAVSAGNLRETKRLLCQGNQPDKERNKNGHTPILLAALLGHHDIYQLLLSYKASVNAEDNYGNSILHLVSNADTLQTLLSLDLDVNGRNRLQRTPLHCAIICRHFDVADILIEQGSDVNAKDIDGNTCLHFVSKCYHYLDMQILENNSGDFDISNTHVRNYVVLFLKRYKVGGFHLAVLEHYQDVFNYICYVTDFIKTIQPGKDILECLERYPEFYALAERLVAHGADPMSQNILGQVPLHLAVDGSNFDLLKLLCKVAPSTVNKQNNIGQTPLVHMYAFTDNYEHEEEEEQKRKETIFSILHEYGADLSLTDVNGFGIMYHATDSLESLKFILEFNPDVNVHSSTGARVLHLLASERESPDEEMAEVLLQMGLNINCRDSFGATALFYATWAGNTEWINLLVKLGCRLDALDHSKSTAMDLALFNKSDDIADILKEHSTQCEGDLVGFLQGDVAKEEESRDCPTAKRPLEDSLKENNLIAAGQQILCLEKSSDVERMFESVTFPVDSSVYICDLLESPVTGRTDIDEENLEIKRAVLHLVTKLGEQFEKHDPRFKMRMELSGSVSEGVKCGRADEFDFLCFLENFESVFHPEEGESDPPGFVRVISNDTSDAAYKEFHTMDGYLINSWVVEEFYRLLYIALHSHEVWSSSKALFPSLYYVPELTIKGPSVDLSLRWLGSKFKDLAISVDMVPALHYSEWWPFAANGYLQGFGSLDQNGCHVVLTTFLDQDETDAETAYDLQMPRYFRISFSEPERNILQSVSCHVRDGFIIAKALREQCPSIRDVYHLVMEPDADIDDNSDTSDSKGNVVRDETTTLPCVGASEQKQTTVWQADQATNDIGSSGRAASPCEPEQSVSYESVSYASSYFDGRENRLLDGTLINTYMLKMALFHELNNSNCNDALESQAANFQTPVPVDCQKAHDWAKRIYNRLQKLVEQGSMPSFFIPKFDLMDRKDCKDFYVFDNLVLDDQLDDQWEEDTFPYEVSNPLPEEKKAHSDELPNCIEELKVKLAQTDKMIEECSIQEKIKKLCFREELLIFISIIEKILRECKQDKQ